MVMRTSLGTDFAEIFNEYETQRTDDYSQPFF